MCLEENAQYSTWRAEKTHLEDLQPRQKDPPMAAKSAPTQANLALQLNLIPLF